MSNAPVREWKSKAFAAIAALYKLREERATMDDRITEALAACERAGCTVDRRWGSEPDPSIEGQEAVSCGCGAVIALTYTTRELPRPLSCRFCNDAARIAVATDAALEKGLPAVAAKLEEVDF